MHGIYTLQMTETNFLFYQSALQVIGNFTNQEMAEAEH